MLQTIMTLIWDKESMSLWLYPQQSPKSFIPMPLFLFLSSFPSPPSLLPFLLAASVVSLLQSHNKHTLTLSKRTHRFRATKDIPLREWECVFWSFGFPRPTNARAEERFLNSFWVIQRNDSKEDVLSRFSWERRSIYQTSRKTRLKIGKRTSRRKRGDREKQDEAIKTVSRRSWQFLNPLN